METGLCLLMLLIPSKQD